ncbi:HAD-like domain-containing protein [Aspergillus varians]
MTRKYKAIILDLGNVVFTWKGSDITPSSNQASLLRASMKTPIYHDYERGLFSRDECHRLLGEKLHVNPTEIKSAFEIARQSLVATTELLDYIRDLKHSNSVAVYAMSNIPQADINYIKETQVEAMRVFDGVFASGYVGARKPEEEFYQVVLKEISTQPHELVFVDDRKENVSMASDLGMTGIVFAGIGALREQLEGLI